MVGIGVQQDLAVEHDPDMALPEHEIIALELSGLIPVLDRLTGPGELHVAVAGQFHTAGPEGCARQPGTIETKALTPAPEIGRMHEPRCDVGGVALKRLNIAQMSVEHPTDPIALDKLPLDVACLHLCVQR